MPQKNRLIVFFIPPKKIVNGGVLSIFSICETSRQFEDIHHSEVVLATYPGFDSYNKNDLFKNEETIYSFEDIVKRGSPASLLLHVPEYASNDIFNSLKPYITYLQAIPELRINILNQNILLMQKPTEVAKWFSLTPHVTQTTAHDKYTSQELANEYNLPTHHLSTFVDASQYTWTPYEKKRNVIALSPDKHEAREAIVQKLKKELEGYEIITIQNMTYDTYKATITQAKYAVTFGEGFDGYFVEPFFSGGIAFAVFNDDFFPDKDFSHFENVYASYDAMLANIVNDLKRLDNKALYEKIVTQNLTKVNKLYSFAAYTKNVKNFYLNNFSYIPEPSSAVHLIGEVVSTDQKVLAEKDSIINKLNKRVIELDKAVQDQSAMIAEKSKAIDDLNAIVTDITNSQSWKVTKPLRAASQAVRKKRQ